MLDWKMLKRFQKNSDSSFKIITFRYSAMGTNRIRRRNRRQEKNAGGAPSKVKPETYLVASEIMPIASWHS